MNILKEKRNKMKVSILIKGTCSNATFHCEFKTNESKVGKQ